jgi:hypothetical protein
VESRDQGRTWQSTEISGLSANVGLSRIFASPRGFLFGEDRRFSRKSIFRSSDNGKTWQMLEIGRIPNAFTSHPTTGTLFLSGSPVMFSTDNGTTWQASRGIPFRASGRLEGASTFVFGTGNTVFLGVRGLGIFRSLNSGLVFEETPFPTTNVYSLKAAPNGNLFALTNNAVYVSENFATSWNARNEGLFGFPNDLLVHDISLDAASEAYLATSRGVYCLEHPKARAKASKTLTFALARTVDEEIKVESLQSTKYSNNISILPNPASDKIIVSLSAAEVSPVKVEILNMRGETVVSPFVEEFAPSSEKNITLSVQHLPQGQYLCRIQRGEMVTSHVFTVLR